ncbi:MAG: hypothetical protein Q8P17_03905 [bacterium]|nr:hypothetical protein [bacterium]
MPTYIIRGWKEEALSNHEFAHREASRRNTYSKGDYHAKAEEFHLDAEDDAEAWKKADNEHPELAGRRELLKVIPQIAKAVQLTDSIIPYQTGGALSWD